MLPYVPELPSGFSGLPPLIDSASRAAPLLDASVDAIFCRIGSANGACTASRRSPASSATFWMRWSGLRRKHRRTTASSSGVISGGASPQAKEAACPWRAPHKIFVNVGRSNGGRPINSS